MSSFPSSPPDNRGSLAVHEPCGKGFAPNLHLNFSRELETTAHHQDSIFFDLAKMLVTLAYAK
jgi:hypothetical protein